MADFIRCDRCGEPAVGETYELYIMCRTDLNRAYSGDMCGPCYAIVAGVLNLPRHRLHFHPGLIDNFWKRLWPRR